MSHNVGLCVLVLASALAVNGQPAMQAPYSSSYTLVSIGLTGASGGAALTFFNPSTILISGGEGTPTIYQLPVTRGTNGHITSVGTRVAYATAGPDLDAGLAYGPGGDLFARGYEGTLYEFKPGSITPDLTTAVI